MRATRAKKHNHTWFCSTYSAILAELVIRSGIDTYM